MKLIFFAVAGRSGSNYLTYLFNKFGKNCFSECEAPDLIFKNNWVFGTLARNFQRKWIVTDEMLGRGKALEWYELDRTHDKLNKIALNKIKRIKHLQRRYKFQTYVETGKFFIKSQCDVMYNNEPDLNLIKLTRNPLLNAKSFVNRNKDFSLDNVPPHYKQNCLQLNTHTLSKYQLYLWNWFETELRYYRFIEKYNIQKYYDFKTENLSVKTEVEKLFKHFNINHEKMEFPKPINTNVSQGKPKTIITNAEVDQYLNFIDKIPDRLLKKIQYLNDFDPYSHL